MEVRGLLLATVASIFVVLVAAPQAAAQEPAIQLPVELVGFPVIILAVRLSNFAKKLAYSLNPRTYVSRSRRAIESDDMIDMSEAEKRLVAELGENVCIYTRVCLYHAEKASRTQPKNRISINWNDIFRNLSQLVVQGRRVDNPSQFQLHPEKFAEYTGPVKPRRPYGYLQNYPRPYPPNPAHQYHPNPPYQYHPNPPQQYQPHPLHQYHPNPSYPPGYPVPVPAFPSRPPGLPVPIPALPPGYHRYPQSFTDALASVALNDEFRCIPKLLCELTSGQKQESVLPFNIDMDSVVRFLSGISGTESSPLLHFGKAILMGYSGKGSPTSCGYAYPRCPQDPDRLVEYLNNHNGGFFRLFNGAPGFPQIPQRPPFSPGQQAPYPFHFPQAAQHPQKYPSHLQKYPNHPQQYSPYYIKRNRSEDANQVEADKRIQNQPVQYVPGTRLPNHLWNDLSNDVAVEQVFPTRIAFVDETVRVNNGRRQKALAFPAGENLEKPLPNLKPAFIFPDRTGTGELRLDEDELINPTFSSSDLAQLNRGAYYRKLKEHKLEPFYTGKEKPFFRFPFRNEDT